MGRLIEKYLPLVVALAITWGAKRYLSNLSTVDVGKVFGTFVSAGLTVTTTLLGFLLAVYSIFQTIDTPRKRFLIQLGQLRVLNCYLVVAVWVLLGTAVVLLGLTLVPTEPAVSVAYWQYVQLSTVFVTAFSLACSARFINIFLRLMVDNSK